MERQKIEYTFWPKTTKIPDKINGTIPFGTWNIRQQRTVLLERWETNEMSTMLPSSLSWGSVWSTGRRSPSRAQKSPWVEEKELDVFEVKEARVREAEYQRSKSYLKSKLWRSAYEPFKSWAEHKSVPTWEESPGKESCQGKRRKSVQTKVKSGNGLISNS